MIEIEASVVGMIIVIDEVQSRFMTMLKKEYFTDLTSKNLFICASQLKEKGIKIDALTIIRQAKINQYDISPSNVTKVCSLVSSVNNFTDYCLILEEEYIKKALIQSCYDTILSSTNAKTSGTELADKLQSAISNIHTSANTSDNVMDSSAMVDKLRREYEQKEKDKGLGISPGITTGLIKMDSHMGGWQRGHLHLIGGRPGMGKSRLVIQHFWAAALANYSPLFFSLEMPESDVNSLMLVSVSNGRIDPKALRSISLSDREKKVKEVVEKQLLEKKYYVSSERSISKIRSICFKYVKERGVSVVFIDFAQKIYPTANHFNSNAAMTEVASELKNLAKDLNIPVVCIVSLSREVEKRGGLKKPELHDIRESGSFESEADSVYFVWRPKYYDLSDPETSVPYTNEIFYLHGKGRFNDEADMVFYHDKNMTRFFENKYEVDEPLVEPRAMPSLRSFVDPEWNRDGQGDI